GGLGEYIFRGLRLNDNRLLLAGAVPSALMALLADFGFGVIERRFDTSVQRSRRIGNRILVWITIIVVAIPLLFLSYRWLRRPSPASTNRHVTVGSKDFTESILLAEIVAHMLEAQHVEVDRRFDLGGNL